MGDRSKIEWTDATWNPWIGCTKVSPGCDHCYAEAWDRRFAVSGHAMHWGAGKARRRTSESNWRQPRRWNAKRFMQCNACGWRGECDAELIGCGACGSTTEMNDARRRVFCASLADVFDNEVPDEWRDEFFAMVSLTPNLDWLVLTKRIGNARAYIADPETPRRVDIIKHVILAGRRQELHAEERVTEIAGWPGYFITSKGRVLSDRTNGGNRGAERHEVKAQSGEAGHARVMLQVAGEWTRELVHRLVLTAFERPPRDGEQGCHIDGNPANNALWNLRWGDQFSNWDDSKRHGTHRRYSKLTPEDAAAIRERHAAGESAAAIAKSFGISDTQVRNIARGAQWKEAPRLEWPLSTVWLGATVVNQVEADRDVQKLLDTPAAVRFVSIEPMLGEIRLGSFLQRAPSAAFADGRVTRDMPAWTRIGATAIDWVIVGGESGPHARPMVLGWAKDIVRQCKAADVPVLVKQLGARPTNREGEPHPIKDRKGGDMAEWPVELRVREFPQEAAR